MRRSALILVCLVLSAACGRISSSPSRETPVILISVDTLRSDHLPAYGYDKVSTPHIDAFRGQSILFNKAYSQCPLTLPSHASMLTGAFPAEHGLRDNIGFRLSEKIPTLPELLKKNGYTTGAAVSAFVLRRETGLIRGFDFYDDEVEPIGESTVIGRVQRDGRDTIGVASKWLEQNESKPFFLFLHLYEPHTPYTPPEPFRSQYANSLYDGEIAFTDQLLGEFFETLKQRGIYDKAMIILTSDHGEGLFDHGEEEHGIFLYREAIQVPLMVKLPKGAKGGTSVDAPVGLIDLFPTILEQTETGAGAARPSNGVSLLAKHDGDASARRIYSETYYPRFHFGWSDTHSLIDGKHHYIRAPIPELYDLETDFPEKKNVLEDNRRVYVSMRGAIEPFVKQAAAPTNIDPEEAAKLAALGYLGSSVSTRPDEVLPDPKTTIEVFHQIRIAYTKYRNEQQEEALQLTDSLLKDNHRILDLWDLKSKILAKLGRNREAIEAAKAGLKEQPTAVALMTAVANLSLLTGDLDQAEKHAELALKLEPGQAREILARVWVERGDYEKASQQAELARKDLHDPTGALITLGLIEKQRGDLNAAMRYLDDAVERVSKKKNHRIPNLHFYRGDVLARLGRNAEAERELRQEIALYPKAPDAYGSLIILLASQGRGPEATRLVFDLVSASPNPPSYVTVSETLKAIGDDRGAKYWAYQGLRKFPKDSELRGLAKQMGVGG